MERDVRATRRELAGYDSAISAATDEKTRAALQQEFDRASVKLKKQEGKLKDWIKEKELTPDPSRVQVNGFGRSASQKAVWANKKQLQNAEKGRMIIKQRIEDGTYSTTISHQQYLKHIDGTKQFEDYAASRTAKGNTLQSRLTISETEAQELIIKLAGSGNPHIERNGNIGKKEYIDCGQIIGEYYENGAYHKTSRAVIHYGKKGSHIVPVKPEE